MLNEALTGIMLANAGTNGKAVAITAGVAMLIIGLLGVMLRFATRKTQKAQSRAREAEDKVAALEYEKTLEEMSPDEISKEFADGVGRDDRLFDRGDHADHGEGD